MSAKLTPHAPMHTHSQSCASYFVRTEADSKSFPLDAIIWAMQAGRRHACMIDCTVQVLAKLAVPQAVVLVLAWHLDPHAIQGMELTLPRMRPQAFRHWLRMHHLHHKRTFYWFNLQG